MKENHPKTSDEDFLNVEDSLFDQENDLVLVLAVNSASHSS